MGCTVARFYFFEAREIFCFFDIFGQEKNTLFCKLWVVGRLAGLANVPFAGWHKIVLKKCVGEKF
jgi:hypothetical protein